MARFTVTRLLDVSKTLTTEVGQQIPDFFRYMALFVEQTVLNLRAGLTFGDNFSAAVKTYTLTHGVPQVVTLPGETFSGAIPLRLSSTSKVIAGFNAYFDAQNKFTVVARFADAADPQGSQAGVSLAVTLVILF